MCTLATCEVSKENNSYFGWPSEYSDKDTQVLILTCSIITVNCYIMLIDWLIVFWVWDLTVPMHLGLTRPFVSHVHQRSPKAPLKFQMAPKLREPCSFNKAPDGPRLVSCYPLGPKRRDTCLSEVKASLRLKTWVTSRFTKVLRYTIHFSQSPGKQIPSRFPKRAPTKRAAHLQGICISLKNIIFQVPR